MESNLFRRIEVVFQILDEQARSRILETLDNNTRAWILYPDGSDTGLQPDTDNPTRAQTTLLEKIADTRTLRAVAPHLPVATDWPLGV